MNGTVFAELWEKSSSGWYENATFLIPGEKENKRVKDYCTIKPNLEKLLFDRYEAVKELVKDIYFKDPSKRISRYKRAAVIAQVILFSDPLDYIDESLSVLDPYLLKQRLAFTVALQSILQAYPEEILNQIKKPYFRYDELDKSCGEEDDRFVLSIYKDMFYAELYKNYNVLTMANVFGLLTERASSLGGITLQ